MSERTLPQGWISAKVGEVLEVHYGKGLPKAKRDKTGQVPVYGSNGVVGQHSKALTDSACIIIGRKGAAGAVHISRIPCWPIDTTYYTTPPAELSLEYIYYVLGFLNLSSLDKSTAIPGLNRDDLYSQPLPLPPLPEQHRIVAEIEKQLTRLDAGVAALRRAQTNLRRYRATVLKAACEGRLVPQDPADEPAAALLERILAERRQRWEAEQIARGKDPKKRKYKEPASPDTSELPELPEGWVWATVEQVCERIVDCLHSTPKFTESGFFCIDTNCIKPGQIVFEKIRYVDEATFIDRNRRMKPRENDILFSREGALLGIAVRVPANLEFCLGQRMMIFRLSRCVDAQYYESVLNSVVFRSQYVTEITGSASPHLNIGDIRRLGIPLPPPAEQQRIITEVERRLSVVEELEAAVEANLKRAERLRQAVLKRAFEGKLVPQNPNDEPASLLLERIRAAREEPEAGGKSNRRSSRRQKRGRGKVSDKQLRLL
jgi:type I restriction enzyme S subunit